MYAVVKLEGHQYRVGPGSVFDIQKISQEEGEVIFQDVLFIGERKDGPIVGRPTIEGARVVGKILKHGRDRKILVLRRSAGKWHKKNGHRQHYTSIMITGIEDGLGGSETYVRDEKKVEVAEKKEA